jgi:hypothetical protein
VAASEAEAEAAADGADIEVETEVGVEAELVVSFMGVIVAGDAKGGGGKDEVFPLYCKPCCGIKQGEQKERQK